MTLPAEASAVMVPASRRAVSRIATRIRTA